MEFIYLDIDDSRTRPFKQQLGYRYQPHIFLIDGDGRIIQQWVGAVQGETIQQALPQIIDQ